MAEYTLEQHIFLYDAYVKYSSVRRCRREFEHRFAGVRITSRSTIHDLVNKVRRTGYFLNKKRVQQRRVLTEEKLDEVGARLEHSPRKSLRRLTQEFNISKTSAFVATKLLELQPYRLTVVHALQPKDPNRHFQSTIYAENKLWSQSMFYSKVKNLQFEMLAHKERNAKAMSSSVHLLGRGSTSIHPHLSLPRRAYIHTHVKTNTSATIAFRIVPRASYTYVPTPELCIMTINTDNNKDNDCVDNNYIKVTERKTMKTITAIIMTTRKNKIIMTITIMITVLMTTITMTMITKKEDNDENGYNDDDDDDDGINNRNDYDVTSNINDNAMMLMT
ncbi:hypothetical protein ANN_02775 [Periplaneta americana]|uniref:DUF4817 domain-containing protein n=1 Tax=Periplaneta americana TaxID=6978 RepID=A0ABQ8TX93_PERAM|nr:hypothetical protein ANN_02775 [Periplaneta americana]